PSIYSFFIADMGSSTGHPLSEIILEFLLHHLRWIPVCFILLPLSFIYDLITRARNRLVHYVNSAPRAHDRKVAKIQGEVREWARGDKKKKMCNARSGWSTMSFRYPLYKNTSTLISTNSLIDILEVDEENRTIRVEPMVSMGDITNYLLPRGYSLPIVPELDDLTVGGMINGCGVESSGRKYGLFQHICVSYEIVTADGSLVVAKKGTEDAESQGLFYGIPWSHGTLGFLVAATIRIIPCKPFVKMTYMPVGDFKDMTAKLQSESTVSENEFVEGIQFSQEMGVVMKGRFSDGPPKNGEINAIGKWHKPWFYTHVEGIGKKNEEVTEYIPLRDYYHRHSKSIFWELEEIIPFGNNVLFRWVYGWLCPPKISFLKYTTFGAVRRIYERRHVLQDMLIPLTDLEKGLQVFHDKTNIYPVWLCPFNLPTCPGFVKQKSGRNVLYVDVGVYGVCKKDDYDPKKTTRELEEYVRSVEGVQMLYADTYMTREEFYQMFDSSLYEWLRVKLNAKDAFPDVYDKVKKEARF
ncbi:hypothetical protein PRIPAC_90930, partial [Pristionchus pacificus]